VEYITINDAFIACYYIKFQTENHPRKIPTIVLIHGFTGTAHHHFKYEIKNYHKLFQTDVLAFDLRGHGYSETGDYKNLSSDIYFEDLEKTIDYFNLKELIIIGASFGGFLANKYTIKYPTRVKKLIIISSSGKSSVGMKNALITLDKVISNFIESNYNFKLLDPSSMKLLSVLLKIHNERPPYNKFMFLKHFLSLFIERTWSILPELKEKVTCPVLIIHGEQDYIELENAKILRDTYKNSKLIIIPNTGHLPQRKNPNLIQNYISQFIMDAII
jgi:pimeloyl-ACP methyl ester carboxylesterase